MSKLRSHWFAVFGGITLLALTMSSAFAGKPDNQGQLVSEYVHSLQSADESETESADESESESPAEPAAEDTESSNHGECVKAVAQDKEAVGGDNENHGGAVSEAARVTCQDEAAADEDAADEGAADEADTEVESDEDAGSESEAESENAGHGNGHDESGEDDSSDD